MSALGLLGALLLSATAAPAVVPEPAEAAEPSEDEAAEELEALRAAEAALLHPAPPGLPPGLLDGLGPGNPLRLELGARLAFGVPPAELSAAAGTLPFPLEAVVHTYDIPVTFNERVAAYLAFFQGPGRKWFGKWLARAGRWTPQFRPILRQHEVPEDLVYLAMIESGFSATATSWASAVGPWQFIEETGRRHGLRVDFWIDERRDPWKSTHAAALFLGKLHREFGDWYLAWAAYNAGPGRVKKGIEKEGTRDFWALADGKAFRAETQGYVPKLIAAALIAKHPAAFGFPPIEQLEPLAWEEVELPWATDLQVIARCAGVPVEAVKELNPELRRWATPPVDKGGAPYRLRVPSGSGTRFAEQYAKVPASERFTFQAHKVQRGDTLGHLAMAYGTSSEAIARVNGIKDVRKLRLGQELIIPMPPGAMPGKGGKVSAAPKPKAKKLREPEPPVGKGWHVLQKNETPGHVALKYGITVQQLLKWNDLSNPKRIRAGKRLRVQPP